jgi:hypothetical protein
MSKPRRLLWFAPGLVAGVLVGASLPRQETPPAPATPSALGSLIEKRVQEQQVKPIRCGAEVDTEGWKSFRDTGLAVEFRYPPTYELTVDSNTMTLAPADGNPDGKIVLEKFRGVPQREVTRDWQMASWKVADRKTFAMTSGYFNDDAGKLWTTYLFIRDFPLGNGGSTFPMVRATIASPITAQEYAAARQAGDVDYESLLTRPEQILSTFRFLQNEELPTS